MTVTEARVRVAIERLVVDATAATGVAAIDRRDGLAVARAIELTLAELLAARGAPAGCNASARLAGLGRIDARPARSGGAGLGAAVASALYEALDR